LNYFSLHGSTGKQKDINNSKYNLTKMQSKEDLVLELFFNKPKHWHFDELHKKADISKPQLSGWLKKFIREGLIKRIKKKGKMPYYIGIFDNPAFQRRKWLFGLEKLNASGLLSHLSTLEGAQLVVLFGSFSRYDWYEQSDIDIFIYGSDDAFEQGKYELALDREIQLFSAKGQKDLRKMGSGLIQNIMEGVLLKGKFDELGVKVHV
jgi:predicted nucleotidyltransferase